MLRQFKQVALTYLTRPTPVEWLGFVIFSVMGVVVFFGLVRHANEPTPQGGTFSLFLYALFLGTAPNAFIANQLHWQFHHPRSALTPGFAGPHLFIALAISTTICILAPAIILAGAPILWFVVAIAAASAIVSQLRIQFLWYPFFALALFGDRLVDGRFLEPWFQAEGFRRPVLIAVTLFSWAAVTCRWLRLTRVREDDIGFVEPVVADPAKLSRPFRQARERAAAARVGNGATARLDRRIQSAATLSPVRKLSIAFVERQPFLATAIGFAIPALLVSGFFILETDPNERWNGEHIASFAFFPAIAVAMAGLMPAVTLAARIPQMTFERLLPLSNQAYADAMLAICFRSAFSSWLFIQAAVALVVFALPWRGFDIPSAQTLAAYLAISLAGLLYSASVGVFCSHMQGCFPLLFGAVTSALATLGLQSYWASLASHESQFATIVWAAIAAAAGLFFAWRARQLWRHKEMAQTLLLPLA